ncbi:hypothetical protein BU17DRAFT_44552 [Hysterangium stoloniferum]|nr:hypothetical protein BU17DRAFT_44552 [Hysterangium stoloniferum]
MHLILTGATGTCGSAVLKHCIDNSAITRVTVLSRRPVPLANGSDKVSVVIHKNFESYPQSLLDTLKGADGCVWALGIPRTKVSKEQYIKITYDYTMAAANAFASLSTPFKFVFVSGEGADMTERTPFLFGNIKGRAEKSLLALSDRTSSLRVYSARPGYIDPEGDHLKPSTMQQYIYPYTLVPGLKLLGGAYIIGTKTLATSLVGLATGSGEPFPPGCGVEAEGRILRNSFLRGLSKESSLERGDLI